MQTPKARPLEVPQRTSPGQTSYQLKMNGSESDSSVSRTSKDRSPKVARRSPKSPVPEQKKRPGRVSEVESQLTQLQEDLKKAKDQLSSSESWKRSAQQEAEEAKRQLIATNAKLEESQRQLLELSSSDDDRLQELRKISQERDRAWQSELEALQNQHSIDSTTLVSARNEIQRLKAQLEMFADSEATESERAETANAELQSLKLEHAKALSLVDMMKSELDDCKESEAQAKTLLSQTLSRLEKSNTVGTVSSDSLKAMEGAELQSLKLEHAKALSLVDRMKSELDDCKESEAQAKTLLSQTLSRLEKSNTVGTVSSDSLKAMEGDSRLVSELEQSRARISSLEELVRALQTNLANAGGNSFEELNMLKSELSSTKLEMEKLKSALEMAEIKYQEEQSRSTMHIRNAYELMEQRKSESTERIVELEETLKKAEADIEELKSNLIDREAALQNISREYTNLFKQDEKNVAMHRMFELEKEMEKLNTNLMAKETELQYISEENDALKSEINNKETKQAIINSEAITEAEIVKVAEQEALMKFDNLIEEANKSSKRATWVTEQLEAAQATNTKLEGELRRLKVQSDQWRKAAEAAAAILSTEDNGKFVDRSASFDSNYDSSTTGKMSSPYPLDVDDDSPKKHNNNMLKKFGVLWKKGPK